MRRAWLALWALFTALPIYWLVCMSLKTNEEILGGFTLFPRAPTLANYATIFGDPSWYRGYVNSLTYASINTVFCVAIALPAAYAFSRYRFLGDKHLFFWLLSNRMSPPAVFLLPFLQLYSAVGLFDTPWAVALAHTLFNVPLAVWILEGFLAGIPRALDETAWLDGWSFPRFFVRILLPLARTGIGVTAFFCFVFSWVELLLARTLTSVDAKPIAATMTRTVSASGMDWGVLAAAGVLTLVPGALFIWFVRDYIAKGFALGRVQTMPDLSWMHWTRPTAAFFALLGLALAAMTVWELRSPSVARKGLLPLATTRGDRLFLGLVAMALVNLAWAGLCDQPQWQGCALSVGVLAALGKFG